MSRVDLTPEIIEHLKNHRTRTGTGSVLLLRHSSEKKPETLNASIIDDWLSHHTKTAEQEHLDYVLSEWNHLPDKPCYKRNKPRTLRVEIADFIDQLDYHHKRTNVGVMSLLRGKRAELPDGLQSSLIESWLRRRTKTAKKEYLDYVLQCWRALPDKPRIELTHDMVNELRAHIERTGCSCNKFFKLIKDTPPKGLNVYLIRSWLSAKATTADQELYEFVIKQYSALPKRRITSTPEIMSEPKYQRKSTGDGGAQLLRHTEMAKAESLPAPTLNPWSRDRKKLRNSFSEARITPKDLLLMQGDIPHSIKARQIEGWLQGKIEEEDQALIQYVLVLCDQRIKSIERIPITTDDRQLLRAEQERTGYNFKSLVNSSRHPIPDKITSTIFSGIISDAYDTIRKDHLQFFKQSYADLPDSADNLRRNSLNYAQNGEITKGALARLHAFRDKGIHPNMILKGAGDAPAGLDTYIIASWLSGTTKTANPDYIRFVLSQCEKLQNSPMRRLIITDEMRAELKGQRKRTGIGVIHLLANSAPSADLSKNTINSWMTGVAETARKDLYFWTINAWLQLPDKVDDD